MKKSKNSFYLILIMLLVIVGMNGCAGANVQNKNNPNRISLNLEYSDNNSSSDTKILQQNERAEKEVKKIQNVPKFLPAGHFPKRMGEEQVSFLPYPNKKVKISVENIPLNKFINLVFGEILKLNYSVSEAVSKRQDKVTLRMDEEITSKKFYSVIEGILTNYNISLDYKDKILFISKGNKQNKIKLDYKVSYGKKFQYQDIPANEVVYQILPIDYLSIDKARSLLFEFALSKATGRVYEMKSINGLLIKDYASNVRRGVELIAMLDHPYMKNKMFKLVYFEHIDVDVFTKRMKKIFQLLNINVANTINGEPISFLPIEEINALFVITDKKELINTVLYWKKKLDNFDELDDKKQIFVYHSKNRSADDIEAILSQVLTNMEDGKQKSITKKEKKSNNPLLKQQENKKKLSEVNITVDSERNMLIFYMLPSEYKNIYNLLKKIDTKSQQILIEVTIAEITLTDSLQYGVEWYLQNTPTADGTNWVMNTSGGLGLGSGGISGIISAKNVTAMFNAFAQQNVLNILSSPKLVVLNSRTASFNVGTQVPIITSQTSASDLGTDQNGVPTLVQNVTYTNTGISTSITPTITSENSIMLKINQTVSEAQNNNTSNISSPIIVNRSITTEVILKHGEELIIGGLIKENKSDTTSKVPLLGDIPGIGELFKTFSTTTDKTELLFIVKPYIIDKVKSNETLYNSFVKMTRFKE